mmetsp:Transcript_56289/g.138257  ORF Transcript_56289/g.138257 Transcript_56289/m.138257 type:complete len:254 (+) Transcript_56289:430-1191(+)
MQGRLHFGPDVLVQLVVLLQFVPLDVQRHRHPHWLTSSSTVRHGLRHSKALTTSQCMNRAWSSRARRGRRRFLMSESQLFIFDFDATLVWTPGPLEGSKLYERETGTPWGWSGWWGRPESLTPPVVPTPAGQDLLNKRLAKTMRVAHDDPDIKVMVLTGRHVGLHSHVTRILRDLGMDFIPETDIVCKSGNLPTAEFKMKVVCDCVRRSPQVRHVTMWDDREPHVEIFRSVLAKQLREIRGVETTVHWVQPDR